MDSRITCCNRRNGDNQVGLLALSISLCLIKRKTVNRRWWERPHLGVENRSVFGQENMLSSMRMSDVGSFVSLLRLRPQTFDKLLSIVGPSITRCSNRPSINPSTRLAVTIRYLATGESAKSLSYTYRLGISTTEAIIKETVAVIYPLKNWKKTFARKLRFTWREGNIVWPQVTPLFVGR